MNPTYPKGTTSRLLATDMITPKTREVLGARIAAYEHPGAPEPGFFTSDEFRTLQAVCARLLPQPDRGRPIDLAGAIDQRLAASKTNGWRYDTMPPDGEAFRRALRGLDETARTMSNDAPDISFERLDASTQDVMLTAVQRGDAAGAVWETMPSTRWFEELLTELATSYYSHPLAQDEIGFAGYADAHGWQRIGLNELELFEPRPITAPRDTDVGGTP